MEADINYNVLRLARKRINLDVGAAAKKIGISNSSLLLAAEDGERKITFKQAEKAAHVYDIPIAFLYFDEIPEEDFPLLDFRLHPDSYGKKLRPRLMKDVFKAMRQRETLIDLSLELSHEIIHFNQTCNISDDPESVGKSLSTLFPRDIFDNQTKRIKRTINLFERLGVYVVQVGGSLHTSVDYADFDGAAIYYEKYPIVLINTHERSGNRQIFTLFHELAHLMLKNRVITDFYLSNESPANADILKIETFCNRVAAAALVPKDEILKIYSDLDYSALSDHFKVSREVIVIRLRNLGVLSQNHCDELLLNFQNEYLASKRRGTGGPNPNFITARNMGGLFINIVREGLSQGKISYYEALLELRMKDKPARRLLYGS